MKANNLALPVGFILAVLGLWLGVVIENSQVRQKPRRIPDEIECEYAGWEEMTLKRDLEESEK